MDLSRMTRGTFDEPVTESAPLAWQLAQQVCGHSLITGADCSWYHGLWQFLRLLDLVATPRLHAEFYHAALGALAAPGRPARIMVSGTADYSLPACVIEACRDHERAPELTVVDGCETPLRLTRWYAQRIGHQLATAHTDILHYEARQPFDAICNHTFLGFFDPASRETLFRRWRGLLAPGGRLLTVNRVRANADGAAVKFTPDEAEAFCRTVAARAGDGDGISGIEIDTLVRAARAYAEHQFAYPVRGREELVALHERNGFRIDSISMESAPSARGMALSGPAIPGHALYACVIAMRL